MASHWRDLVLRELLDTAERCCGIDISAPGFRERSLAAAAEAAKAHTVGVEVRDTEVDRSRGPAVPLRIYRPTASNDSHLPAILHFHGGGFVSGGLDTGHRRLGRLSVEVGSVVVSVDYRLSPEHPYPAALEDARDALVWLHGNAASLGVNPRRVALHGISAGGAIAAALAIAARELPLPPLRFQYLSMALLDDRQSTVSATRFTDTPVWNRANALFAWEAYLGSRRRDVVDLLATPGRTPVEQLARIAPTHITVLELDPTRDEGISYAQKLSVAGNSVGLTLWPGTFHAFMSMAPGTTTALRHDAEESRILRAALCEPDPHLTDR
jgi:acetyl esterase